MVDEYIRLNKLLPSIPKASEPDLETSYFTLGSGTNKSFIHLKPLYPWPQAPLPAALVPEMKASLPWSKYFKNSTMEAFQPVVGHLLPQLAVQLCQ